MSSMTQSNSNEMPLLTFNSLYILLREEKKNSPLQTLPDMFYEALVKFFQDKKAEIKRLTDKGETDKVKKEKRIFTSSKKIALELFQIRLSKISQSAIKTEIFEEEFKDENLNGKEEDFYNQINDATKKMKEVLA